MRVTVPIRELEAGEAAVGSERESAHRLYFGSRLRIASYHFTRVL